MGPLDFSILIFKQFLLLDQHLKSTLPKRHTQVELYQGIIIVEPATTLESTIHNGCPIDV